MKLVDDEAFKRLISLVEISRAGTIAIAEIVAAAQRWYDDLEELPGRGEKASMMTPGRMGRLVRTGKKDPSGD